MGHPSPTYKNDRAWKAFELFIPELDKEVDMASDLLKAMFGGVAQVGNKLRPSRGQVTPEVKRMLSLMSGEMTREEIQDVLGLKDEKHFREHYQQIAVKLGLVEMTIPDKPRSSKQKYRLTEKGRRILAPKE